MVAAKQLRAEIKNDSKGIVDLVFAEFNVKDNDGDVTFPGAFEDGAKVPVSAYNHGSTMGMKLPVGHAVLKSTQKEARASAQFYMDTPDGLATFTTIKNLHEAGIGTEWSYGYDPVKYDFGEWNDGSRVRFLYKQKVHEVSPVLQGAGTNTRVLSMKGQKQSAEGEWTGAIKGHTSPTVKAAWNAADVMANIPDDASIADLHSMFAYVDPGRDPEFKSSYMFPHHHGPNAEANVRGCVQSIAILNAMADVMDERARKAVYDHLARHIKDHGSEPPALRLSNQDSVTLNDELMDALGGVSLAIDSASRVVALRAQKGKGLSHVNSELMEWLLDEMGRLRSMFTTPEEDAANAFAEAVRRQHGGTR